MFLEPQDCKFSGRAFEPNFYFCTLFEDVKSSPLELAERSMLSETGESSVNTWSERLGCVVSERVQGWGKLLEVCPEGLEGRCSLSEVTALGEDMKR